MFGLSLGGQLIQGSAKRTWNCISQVTNLLWYKLNNRRQPIMPRQRRRHHSRSRSRSRSHSQDKDRDAKRRRVEVFDSPNHKRSVSLENGGSSVKMKSPKILRETQLSEEKKVEVIVIDSDSEQGHPSPTSKSDDFSKEKSNQFLTSKKELFPESHTESDTENDCKNAGKNVDSKSLIHLPDTSDETTTPSSKKKITIDKTPTRRITPKQIQKKLESEKKRLEREKEREDREKQKQDEKEKKEAEKMQKKEQKQKELELKQKEKEEKDEQKRMEREQKKQEKEKKEEQKRKEKEEEKLKKQQELDEKNREKQKEEEKKQKAVAAFVSFFVPKKMNNVEEKKADDTFMAFMPFEVKSDMKLPLPRRKPLTEREKDELLKLLRSNQQEASYLKDLKSSTPRTCPKTWPYIDSEADDIMIVEDEEVFGETICEQQSKSEIMRAKYLKFHENRRPAYYGTWRKKANCLSGRKPFAKEKIFDYELDSDDEWEEEEQGENLEVLSDDDKENEMDNDDYEVDNEFFVPHGHLSDDEVDDEETSRLSPESLKEKLKLLKDAFDEDIKSKTQKIKPRSIGCIWYDKDGKNVDAAIDRYLIPLAVITIGQITIKKRDVTSTEESSLARKRRKPPLKEIPDNLMIVLLKLVHGSSVKRTSLVTEFLKYLQSNNCGMELSKSALLRHITNVADWTKHPKSKGMIWIVNKHVAEKYGVELALPND